MKLNPHPILDVKELDLGLGTSGYSGHGFVRFVHTVPVKSSGLIRVPRTNGRTLVKPLFCTFFLTVHGGEKSGLYGFTFGEWKCTVETKTRWGTASNRTVGYSVPRRWELINGFIVYGLTNQWSCIVDFGERAKRGPGVTALQYIAFPAPNGIVDLCYLKTAPNRIVGFLIYVNHTQPHRRTYHSTELHRTISRD